MLWCSISASFSREIQGQQLVLGVEWGKAWSIPHGEMR